MLLGQEIIPGYEFLYMRIIYAVVMLVPLLYFLAVTTHFPSNAFLDKGAARLSPQAQIARYVAFPLIWNASIAYVLLVTFAKNIWG